jgi:hypothetical protein
VVTSRAATVTEYLAELPIGCLRFKSLDDLPLESVGRIIAAITPAEFIAFCDNTRWSARSSRKKK